MPGRKSSVFLRKSKPPKRPKYSQKPKINKSTKPRKTGDALKNGINGVSAVSIHIQKLLDTVFAPAPPVLREYLMRADSELRDLIKLMVTKLGGTPDQDNIVVTASTLLEDLAGTDPELADKLAQALEQE